MTLMKLNPRNPSFLLVVGILAIVAVSGIAYEAASTAAVSALHSKYDAYIEARVTVGPSSGTPMAAGANSPAWSADKLSVDFGTPTPGEMSKPLPIKITNLILIDDCRIHVRSDNMQSGIHVFVSETMDAYSVLRVDLSRAEMADGTTFNLPTGRNKTSTPGFGILVDPNVPPGEYTFHLILSYSYCND